jgi:hypothetical protein
MLFLGAFLHYHQRDTIAWRYLGKDHQSMSPLESPLEHVIRPRFTCQGNGRWTESNAEHRAEELKQLRDIAQGKVSGCDALHAFLQSIRQAKGRKLPHKHA